MEYKHFVITRFNLTIRFGNYKKDSEYLKNSNLDINYLKERFKIFEKYTFPSMQSQTCQNFHWVILFHKHTPDEMKRKIDALKQQYGFIDVYLDDGEKFSFANFVNENHFTSQWYLTSRIDNDDMFSPSYIEEIQKYAQRNMHRCIITFDKGIKLDLVTGKKFFFRRRTNHFLSMISQEAHDILRINHSRIDDSGEEIVTLNSDDVMWYELIHSSNVFNSIQQSDLKNQL